VIYLALALPVAFAEGPVFSGLLDSKVSFSAGTGNSPDFSYGIEEYANLRLQTKIRDRATFYGSFNLIALSGTFAKAADTLGLVNVTGENYAATLELERLYFRLNGERIDVDVGLMRLGFGYGQIFAPSDFLNPRNPLFPDVRPRGILGVNTSVYPFDTAKLTAFATAGKDPLNTEGGGVLFGLSGENHWDRASLQFLYSLETPQTGSCYGIHRGGLSFKADAEIGIVADMLYTINPEEVIDWNGLSASAGFDYNFFKGDLYVLAEYLYSGSASSTVVSENNLAGFAKQNYLYAMTRYNFSDYTNASLGCIMGLDDVSFSPMLSIEHDLFQGMTLTAQCQIPLDRDMFINNGKQGEFGPVHSGSHFLANVKVRLRF
jgi:hypothetical protein